MIIILNISMLKDLTGIINILEKKSDNFTSANSLKIALLYLNTGKFTDSLIKGAQETANKEKIYLKIFSPRVTEHLKITDYFQLAMLADFDGVIVDGQEPKLISLIEKAYQKHIPVVTILSDLPDSKRISYVGTDNHRAGYYIGRTMLKNFSGKTPRLAIVSTDYGDEVPVAEYLKIFGFKEAICSISNTEIITWKKAKANMLEATKIINTIINEDPEINGIFTTQEVTTIAAANILANHPELDITLIGYGDTQEIREYINQGIIYASAVLNSQQIGSNAVKELLTYLREKKINIYSNINIQLLSNKGEK